MHVVEELLHLGLVAGDELVQRMVERSAKSWVPSVATMTTSGRVPAATRVRILAKKSLQSVPWIADDPDVDVGVDPS